MREKYLLNFILILINVIIIFGGSSVKGSGEVIRASAP